MTPPRRSRFVALALAAGCIGGPGCYLAHERDHDAATAAFVDGGSPAPIDAGPGTSDCVGFEAPSPRLCARLSRERPRPLLRYAFDDDLRNSGSAGPRYDAVSRAAPRFVEGPSGRALRLSARAEVRVDRAPEVLAGGGPRTISLYVRDPGEGEGWAFLHCRTFEHGFETYRGSTGPYVATCFGAGHPATGPGGCAGAPFCARVWHHLILRFPGDGRGFEQYVDGELVASSDPRRAAAGYEVFEDVAPLVLGRGAGDGSGSPTRYALDDLRVYDRVLAPDEQLLVTTCPPPE